MIFSKTIDTVHNKKHWQSSGSSLLNYVITFTMFISSGKIPACKDKLEIYVKRVHIDGTSIFNIKLLILSYPGAEGFKDRISLLISATVTSSRFKKINRFHFNTLICAEILTGIFLDKDGPTSIRTSLIFSHMIFISAIYKPSFNSIFF